MVAPPCVELAAEVPHEVAKHTGRFSSVTVPMEEMGEGTEEETDEALRAVVKEGDVEKLKTDREG